MPKKITESKLWGIVKEGLEKKEQGYICSNPEAKWKKIRERGFICMGVGDVQADVIGFKDIGTFLQPKLEVIAVEVKPDFPHYRQTHIDQAKRTSSYAHRSFFAAPREFKREEIKIAIDNGIGLFQIDVKSRTLKQVAPSRLMHPRETNVIRLMYNLGYSKCAVCGCYWNQKLISKRYAVKYYIAKNIFSKKVSKDCYKFICHICAQRVFKILSPELRERYAEAWRVKGVIRKQETLKNSIKYFGEREDRRYKKLIKEIKNIKNKI